MSQGAVEQVLGRLITDPQFRRLAADSMEAACLREGYRLLPQERQLLCELDLNSLEELAVRLDLGLRRASDGT